MKVWIVRYSDFHEGISLHLSEPEWNANEYEWESDCVSCDVWVEELLAVGFRPLPEKENQCCEYDLSGKKPELLCTWEPNDEEVPE